MLSPKTFVDDQKDTILQRSLESLETRYQESKARNQKLLEHLQNREKEFQKELETMRKKLEEQKIGFRNLEDKNLELQYEVNSFKQKEKKYLDQISSLKVIARNYQEKLKTQGYSKNAKAATMTNLGEYDIRDSTSTADSDFQRLSPPNYQNNSPGKKNISGSMIFCMSSPNKEKSSPKRDFRFARSEYIKSLQNLDIENNVLNEDKKTEKNVKGKQVRFEYKRGGTLDEEINEVIMEESASPSPYKKKDNVQNTQGSAEKISAHSIGLKKRSSLLHIEDPEYINKFNKLSENIVSLVIKPEISVEDPKEAIPTTISPVKTFEQDSPDTAKRSVLKYTNKLRKPSLFSAASPQVIANKIF